MASCLQMTATVCDCVSEVCHVKVTEPGSFAGPDV